MFRFETIVGLVIALSSVNLHADDKGQVCGKEFDAKEAKEKAYLEAKRDPTSKKEFIDELKALSDEAKNTYKECRAGESGAKDNCNSQKTVDDLQEKVKKAKREFHNACGSAGYSTSAAGHNIECSESLEKCRVCGSKTGATDNPGMCATSSSDDEDSSSSSGDDLKINFSKLSRQAEYCPHLGAKAQKDYEKRYDASRKDVKDMEKKLPDVQKKYTEAMNKGEDEAGQAEDKMVKAQQNLDQELGEAEEKYKQAKNEIAAQIVQLQQQIAQVDDQTRQMALAKADAETQYNEAIRQIELNCYQSASATVAKLQADRLSRPFNRGGFQSMMKQVGLSDRASWQRLADKYYRYCINSTPTKASKKKREGKL